jgi:hypothetical protein
MNKEKEVQEKFLKCVEILDNIENAVALVLQLTDEFDGKTPLELIKYALVQYEEFDAMTVSERLELDIQSEALMEKIKEINPNIEIIDDRANQVISGKPKKEMMN